MSGDSETADLTAAYHAAMGTTPATEGGANGNETGRPEADNGAGDPADTGRQAPADTVDDRQRGSVSEAGDDQQGNDANQDRGRAADRGDHDGNDGGSRDGKGDGEAAEDVDPTPADPGSKDGDKGEKPGGQVSNSHLPRAVRDKWTAIPEDARGAISETYQQLTDKLATQGREVKALQPFRNSLEAVKREIPAAASMTDKQLVESVYELAKTEVIMREDPLKGLVQMAQHFGVLNDLRGALDAAGEGGEGGQKADLHAEIAQLRQQVKDLSDPEYHRQHYQSMVDEQATDKIVSEFIESAEHWDAVVDALPMYIQMARQKTPDALQTDLLARAYDMAVHADPELREKLRPAADPTPAPAEETPRKKGKADDAASLSVTTSNTGNARQLSEDEMLRATFRRATAS